MMVGLGRLELPTSRLSSARSNQLSYKPETPARPNRQRIANDTTIGQGLSRERLAEFRTKQNPTWRHHRKQPHGLVREERETKAAKSRKMAF
jgi:hypothetical protein